MKKFALVFIALVISLVFVGGVMAAATRSASSLTIAKAPKVTAEQARKIALKKIEGNIEEEYTLEDDEGEISTYVFIIKQKKDGKMFEVQIDAADGKVISAEEQEDYDDEDEDPPMTKF